jgi:hypothetical protein
MIELTKNPYQRLAGQKIRATEDTQCTSVSHREFNTSIGKARKFVDSNKPIRQMPIIHRAAEHAAEMFPDGQLTPIRDRVGCYGYLLDSRDTGIRAVLGAKSSTAGGWLSLNEKLLEVADKERRRLLLVVLPSEEYPDRQTQVLEIDIARVRREGKPNRYNGQPMANFTWSCTHPFRLRQEPPQKTITTIQQPLFGGL